MRTDADDENKRVRGGFHLLRMLYTRTAKVQELILSYFCRANNRTLEQVGLEDRYETAAAHNQTERNDETDNKKSKSLSLVLTRFSNLSLLLENQL